MKIVTADITGSLIVNGVDVTNNVVSSSVFSGSIAGRVTSLEQFSASLDATFATDASVTASILVLSQSVQASQAALSSSYTATSGSFVITSGSYAAASASLSTRVTNTEATASTNTQASASFAAYSSSMSTRLTTDETNITTLTNASASFAVQSASLSIRVTNLESTSSTVSSSFASTSGSIAGRVTIIEGQDATTGSNIFTGPQFINQASNAISFTSTASLYTDGGLRVSKDSFVSGTAYFNNVVVYGTSSIQYITSSQVNFGTNIITVNTDTPAVRFGGLAVFDSGSTQLTGSMLWDSEKNHWIYSNPSGSSYNSAMLMNGPRNTGSLGNEQGTTSCALMMGQGGDHITSSAIFHYGNATCFYGQSYISSSGAASFNGSVNAGTGITIGTSGTNDISWNTAGGIKLSRTNIGPEYALSQAWDGTCAYIDIGASSQWNGGIRILPNGGGNVLVGTTAPITSAAGYTVLAINNAVGGGVLEFQSNGTRVATINNNASQLDIETKISGPITLGTNSTERARITSTGIACFACQVCAPAFVGGTVCGTSTYFNINSTSNVGFFQGNDGTTTLGNSFNTVHRNANDGNGRYSLSRWQTQNSSGLDQSAFVGVQSVSGVSNYNPNLVLGISTGASSYSTYLTITSCGYVAVTGNQALSCVPYLQGMSFGWNRTNGQGESMINWTNAGGGSACDLTFNFRDSSTLYERLRIASNGNTSIAGDLSLTPLNSALIFTSGFARIFMGTTEAIRITSTGITTFACQVCSPYFVGGTILSTGTITASQGIITNVLGLNVGNYNYYSQTVSGAMGILGHNVRANGSIANQVDVVNSGWISSMIKQYYNEGITFHTSPTMYNAGDIFPMDTTQRLRIGSDGISCFSSTVCAPLFTTANGVVVVGAGPSSTEIFTATGPGSSNGMYLVIYSQQGTPGSATGMAYLNIWNNASVDVFNIFCQSLSNVTNSGTSVRIQTLSGNGGFTAVYSVIRLR